MRLAQAAAVAAIVLVPSLARADVIYRLDAVVNSVPEVFGTISITRTVIATGSLSLTRSCPQYNPCFQAGPWDQVSFDLIGPLQLAVEQTAPGTVDRFQLAFASDADVTGGQILIEGAENTPAAQLLRASLGGEGGCTGTTLCGVYLPHPIELPLPVSITFVQQLPSSVPEPRVGWPLLLAGFIGLPWLHARSIGTSAGPSVATYSRVSNCPLKRSLGF